MFVINTTCPSCGKTTPVQIRRVADYRAWQNGKHVQNALPYLSAAEREMLISGFCSACWEKIFGGEDE